MPKVTKEYKENRRREILDIAKQVFIKQGFESTTMSDVIQATKMSRGGVYSYFSSTDEMFQAIAKDSEGDFEEYMDELYELPSMWDALMKIIDTMDLNSTNPNREGFGIVTYEYLIMSWREQERVEFFNERIDRSIKLYSRIIEKGIKNKEFKPLQSPEAVALTVINTNDSIYLLSMTVGSEKGKIKDQIESLRLYLEYVLQVEPK